jgi:hypothetical protein
MSKQAHSRASLSRAEDNDGFPVATPEEIDRMFEQGQRL